jgi:2-dehydro-3-deoxyphosphogluconate aldolase/(4S)-4-hydroxy-2-oxoglutarate aldolase
MTPGDFALSLWDRRASAILRCNDAELAARAMDAAIRGGFRTVELTLTTPGALEIIADLAQRELGGERLVVGAGTVLRVEQARAAVRAGARFLVSPIFDPEIVTEAAALGVAAIPGVHTPTEMVAAHRAGAPLVKLFPAPAGGPTWLRSALAPLPFLRVVPTNGVDLDNLGAWLHAGAWAVGLTTALFEPDALARGDTDAIERRARALIGAARAVERGHAPRAIDPFA